jgi:hypothetical protein
VERYFHWLGRDEAEAIARDALTNGQAIERDVATMRAAGCDERLFAPCANDADQVTLLASIVMGES